MRQRKKSRRPAVFITGAVLFVLLVLAAWKLTGERRQDTADSDGAVQQGTELPVPEETKKPAQSKPTEKEDPEEELTPEQEAEKQKQTFLPDYTSAAFLNTTPLRCLSVEVGAKEDELYFKWMSADPSAGEVLWMDVSSGDMKSFQAKCSVSVTVPGFYVNKAVVTGIVPGAAYSYQVGNDAARSPEYTYQRPKKEGNNLTFLVTADAQIGQSDMEDPRETAERWDSVLTRLTSYVPEADFLFHLGDQVADFGSQEHYEMFLDHLALYRIPLAPVVGNHDVANEHSIQENGHPGGPYFSEHFYVPNRSSVGQSQYDTDGNYYFIRGNVLFIVLNSSTSQGSAAQEQYVAQITAEHPDVRWKILAQHFPAYPGAVKSHTDCKEYLARIAADNDIDLILGAHDHAYSRTAFVNRDCETLNDYPYDPGSSVTNPEGTLYVTCGTSSGCLYHEMEEEIRIVYQGQPYAPVAIRFDVTDTQLHMETYLVDSWTLFDEYTIEKM